jgi:hypothetical protein
MRAGSAFGLSGGSSPPGDAGAAGTSLDPLESNPPPPSAHLICPRFGSSEWDTHPPITELESTFRHSGWAARRRQVWAAFNRLGVSQRKLEAFADCGNSCFVQVSPAGDDVRLTCNQCHDRHCLACAAAKGARIAANINAHIAGRAIKMVTLTQRASETPLRDQITAILRDFAALRRRKVCRRCFTGGAAFLEIKIGENSGLWHVHLHILVEGAYLDQKTLSAEWLAVTGASFIVHIEAVRDHGHAAAYVTKYVTKPASAQVYNTPARLDEFIGALKGRRLCATFGTWRGLKLDDQEPPPEGFICAGSLDSLVSAARDFDARAIAVLQLVLAKYPQLDGALRALNIRCNSPPEV